MRVGHRLSSKRRKWVFIVFKWLPSVVQLVGFAALTVGASLWSSIAGWVVGGVSLIVAGVALERSDA